MKKIPSVYGMFALLVSLMLASGSGCGRQSSGNSSQHAGESRTKVEVIPARKGSLSMCLSLTGTLAPFQQVRITSKIPGRVEKVFVEEGDKVSVGDTLIQLEQEELVLGVKQAEAALASAEVHLGDTKSDYVKIKNLYEEKAIPGQKWEKIQASLKVTEAQAEQAKAALALAEKQLSNANIKSPIEGILTRKSVEPGEVVSPPMMPGMPLLQVMKLDRVKAKVNVSEKKINEVHVGQQVDVRVDGLPGKIFSGEISKIAPVVDSRSRTFEVEFDIPNPQLKLKAGMFARVNILLEKRSDILLLPLEAILDKGEHKVIFLAENNVAQQRTVTVGLDDGINAEIISGVREGENVIVRGNIGIEEGTRILIESAEERSR